MGERGAGGRPVNLQKFYVFLMDNLFPFVDMILQNRYDINCSRFYTEMEKYYG